MTGELRGSSARWSRGMSVQARDGASEEELAALADVALAAWR